MIHFFDHNAVDSMQIAHPMRCEATPHHDLLVVLDRVLHQLGIVLFALVVFASITPRSAIVAKDERRLIGIQNAAPPSDRPMQTSFTPRDANGTVCGTHESLLFGPRGNELYSSLDSSPNSSN